jgi:predicted house-cleaning noncanonical NTP pyrophosphatase (MazG superfamily)
MHDLPDEYLADVMPIAKRIAKAQGFENYNILQVNEHRWLERTAQFGFFHPEQRTDCSSGEG